MKIIILGGDGFCGWPTALHLSARGHEIVIVDNLSRRTIDRELGVASLTPVEPLGKRIEAWHQLTGERIQFHNFDIAEQYRTMVKLLAAFRPDAVVHFAEQSSAPFSMKSSRYKRYTVANNLNGTNNLLCALVECGSDAHVIHLGTMGVYGYGIIDGVKIPEGYLEVSVRTESGRMVSQEILYPPNPGSIYHLTKTQDQLLFAYYAKNDKLRITDLHQGIVWGTQTEETRRDPMLINRFSYDGDYGTVLNRFLMQAAVGYPLTVHGTGEQTRAFINLQDTVRCIELAALSPPQRGERVRIMNQMTEVYRVIDLANVVATLTGASIEHVDNPRNEAPANDLVVTSALLPQLGLKPTLLASGLMAETAEIATKFKARADLSKIKCTSTWIRAQAA